MPIVTLEQDSLEQLCARCDTRNGLPLSALTAGIQRDAHIEPRIIAMPPCSACGAREFLIRSAGEPDAATPGSYAHLHRLLVDVMHARLVQLGRVIEAGPREPEAGTSESELARWFPGGLRLPPPPAEGESGGE